MNMVAAGGVVRSSSCCCSLSNAVLLPMMYARRKIGRWVKRLTFVIIVDNDKTMEV